jgi:leader peptidase (prepilin peptidase)/N-methyltransferase
MFDVSPFSAFLRAHPALWAGFAAFVGACLASFGGVVADRLPHSSGFRANPKPGVNMFSPSRCDGCGTRVNPVAAIPVFGWLLYKGKCASCRVAVPWSYPAMETLAAVLSAVWAIHFGVTQVGGLGLLLIWGSLIVAWVDWREAWIPDRLVVPLCLLGLLASPFAANAMDRIYGLSLSVGVLVLGFQVLSWRRGQDLFAAGDIMFCAMAGGWLGLGAVPAFLLLVAAFYAGHWVLLRVLGVQWTPPEGEILEIVGDGFVIPMGPALVAGLLTSAWFSSALTIPMDMH